MKEGSVEGGSEGNHIASSIGGAVDVSRAFEDSSYGDRVVNHICSLSLQSRINRLSREKECTPNVFMGCRFGQYGCIGIQLEMERRKHVIRYKIESFGRPQEKGMKGAESPSRALIMPSIREASGHHVNEAAPCETSGYLHCPPRDDSQMINSAVEIGIVSGVPSVLAGTGEAILTELRKKAGGNSCMIRQSVGLRQTYEKFRMLFL